MKIVYFGTPAFAAEILEKLIDAGEEIVAVVTKPDRPRGRSRKPVATEVKAVAEARLPGVPVYQPEKVSTQEYYDLLAQYDADLFVVVAYGEIISQPLLDMPKRACINVHGSLLPSYRGAAPIQRCLLDGVKTTGVTIMHMVKKMDAGDIIATKEIPVSDSMTGGELERAMRKAGGELLLEVIALFKAGEPPRIPQDEALVTMAPKVSLVDAHIDWDVPAQVVHNQVRAFSPRPNAWCTVEQKGERKRLKIGRSEVIADAKGAPGTMIRSGHEIHIFCRTGALRVLDLQLEGKRMMSAQEFLQGVDVAQLQVKT